MIRNKLFKIFKQNNLNDSINKIYKKFIVRKTLNSDNIICTEILPKDISYKKAKKKSDKYICRFNFDLDLLTNRPNFKFNRGDILKHKYQDSYIVYLDHPKIDKRSNFDIVISSIIDLDLIADWSEDYFEPAQFIQLIGDNIYPDENYLLEDYPDIRLYEKIEDYMPDKNEFFYYVHMLIMNGYSDEQIMKFASKCSKVGYKESDEIDKIYKKFIKE